MKTAAFYTYMTLFTSMFIERPAEAYKDTVAPCDSERAQGMVVRNVDSLKCNLQKVGIIPVDKKDSL